ncbi:MAG: sulfite exporter TauE/SafE family protein [Flavobacteriaceae bacterium]|nr:sulfite exporter TauE/SafE family protein [Flavobacteriaceae bacterium]
MLWSGFIIGLLGSLHCIGMCGPIAFMLPVDRSNNLNRIVQVSMYHIGRLLTYTLIGLIFGWIGQGLYLFGIQQQLSIIIGLAMILIVVLPSSLLNRFSISRPIYRLISKLKSTLGSTLKKRSPDTLLTIGFLNGFLPCGLVYMAAIGSVASGSILEGALYMFLFGLGTVPMMTGAIYFGKFINQKTRNRIRRAIPVFVVIIGVLFVLRGLGLGIPYISPAPMVDMAGEATINCH